MKSSTNTLLNENVLLKQKVAILTARCQHFSYKYDQLNITWQHKYNESKEKYIDSVHSLQRQINIKNLQFKRMHSKIQSLQQQSISDQKKYETNMQRSIQRSHHEIKQQREGLKAMTNEILIKNQEISQQDEQITKLEDELLALQEQYKNELCRPFYKSPSTQCILSAIKSETVSTNMNFTDYASVNASVNTSSIQSIIAHRKNQSMGVLSPIMEEPFHLSPSELFKLEVVSDNDSTEWKSYISDFDDAQNTSENLYCIDGDDEEYPALPQENHINNTD